MEKFRFEKPFIRKPAEPRKPAKTKEKTGKTSLEEGISFTKEALTKDPEKKEQPDIIQKSEHVGFFRSLVKKGEEVKKDQKIGFITVGDIEEKVKAISSGIIKDILPNEKAGYEIIEKRGKQNSKKQTISTSVEYGQELFTITPTAEK